MTQCIRTRRIETKGGTRSRSEFENCHFERRIGTGNDSKNEECHGCRRTRLYCYVARTWIRCQGIDRGVFGK